MRVYLLFAIYLFAYSSSGWAIVKINGYTPTTSNADYLQYVRYLTVPIGSQSGTTWDAGNNTTGLTDAQIQSIVTAIVGLEAPLNQEIYHKMQSSTETFSFTSVSQAEKVVQHRIQTVAMMQSFNQHAQFNYTFNGPPGQDFQSFVSDWHTGSPTKFYFVQIGGTPDQAINQLCAIPASPPNVYGECKGAIEACIWWGADQAYGASAFNVEFGSSPLNMDDKRSNTPHHHLANAVDTSVIIPGDWVYFENDNYGEVVDHVKDDPVLAAVLNGKSLAWRGENAIYLGSNLGSNLGIQSYQGLGAGGIGVDIRVREMENYNSNLQPVRDKFGNTYKGMNISPMTSLDAPTRIRMNHIQRIVP